jgi:N-acetylmuramoyl-L-alanine amidase
VNQNKTTCSDLRQKPCQFYWRGPSHITIGIPMFIEFMSLESVYYWIGHSTAQVLRITAVFCISLCVLSPALALPPATFNKVRTEYFRLRNVDPTGVDPVHQQAWDKLAREMRSASSQSGSFDSAQLRLLAADTHLRLYRSSKNAAYLNSTEALLIPLINAHSLTPEVQAEAHILRGDAALCRQDMVLSSEAYQAALDLGGVSSLRAEQRLIGIQNGTYRRFMPVGDLEVPRVVPATGRLGSAAHRPTIVLDPGHGGEDAGAVSSFGGEEKEITLDIARRVKTLLEGRLGYRVMLTRDTDRFVPLARRTAMANLKEADVFVSLHVNASADHNAEGLEVYYLDNTNDEASRKLAERENGVAPGDGVDDLSFILSDLIQSGKLEDSIVLSRAIDGALRRSVIAPNRGLRSLGVKKAPFFVLVGAHMPCLLLEMFFIDNPNEGRKLQHDSFRAALASGIADGIRSFLAKR